MGAGASAEPRPRPQPRIIRLGQGNHGNFILLDGRARAQPQMIIHRNGTLVANNGTTNGLSLQPGSSLAILAALAASELRWGTRAADVEALTRLVEHVASALPHAVRTRTLRLLAATLGRACAGALPPRREMVRWLARVPHEQYGELAGGPELAAVADLVPPGPQRRFEVVSHGLQGVLGSF